MRLKGGCGRVVRGAGSGLDAVPAQPEGHAELLGGVPQGAAAQQLGGSRTEPAKLLISSGVGTSFRICWALALSIRSIQPLINWADSCRLASLNQGEL